MGVITRGSKGAASTRPRSPSTMPISSGNPIQLKPSPVRAPSPLVLDDAEEQNAHEPQVYMAALQQGKRIGISVYNGDTRQLHVLEILEDLGEDFPTLQLLKYQEQPSIIYTSSNLDDVFLAALEKKVSACNAPEVKVVKSPAFNYEKARHRELILNHSRLAYVRISGIPADLDDKERMQVLSSMVDMDSDIQVRAAGGLLLILEQESLFNPGDEEYGSSEIEIQISELSLNGFMKLDETTHEALQIFQVDKHPSLMGIGRSKEGFSIYGLLNKCVTMVGRRLMRVWFLRPILDLEVLNDRLDTISFLLAAPDVALSLHITLKRVKDIPQLLKKFSSPSSFSTSTDWLRVVEIRKILSATLSQRHTEVAALKLRIINRVVDIAEKDLVEVLDLLLGDPLQINGVIDFDQSSGEHSDTLVRRGISEELDELKDAFEGLPGFLNRVAGAENMQLQHQLPQGEGCIVYIPQVGYLMCFAKEKLGELVLENRPDFEFAFAGGDDDDRRFFYHTRRTRELDEMLGDIYHRILDMEHSILRTLQARIIGFARSLNEATSVAAGLDCLVAFSISATEYKCNRPDIREENILVIKNGRHLLQEQTVERFIPNDTVFEDGSTGRIHVITGPNCSGKSIYLKQVGLIVFLAHLGSFVPADEAIVGLTDRIFTRIGSKETVRIPRSAFMIDLHQISVMLRHVTSRSLCLMDEFGKGTLTTDGIGLLCATLKHVAAFDEAPKVLATTHFSEVYDAHILPESGKISFYSMGIVKADHSSSNGLGDIVFVFRLQPGRVTPSYGLHCAEIAGVPQEVLERAIEVVERLKTRKPVGRLETTRMTSRDRLYKELVGNLAAFDSEAGHVIPFLESVFLAAKEH